MAVHRTDLALLELDLDHHDVVVVTKDLALGAAAGVLPGSLGLEDEISALFRHDLFVLGGLGFGRLLGLLIAAGGQQAECSRQGDEGDNFIHLLGNFSKDRDNFRIFGRCQPNFR